MGSSVIKQTQAREVKRFLGTGLQPVKEEIPSNYAENPCFCPYLLDETCEAAKDPEYKTRCRSETFGYLNCKLYASWENQKKKIPKRNVSDPLSDTVIMSAEDIAGSHKSRHTHHSKIYHHTTDDSLHDRVAEGENDTKFGYLRRCLRTEAVDDRADF